MGRERGGGREGGGGKREGGGGRERGKGEREGGGGRERGVEGKGRGVEGREGESLYNYSYQVALKMIYLSGFLQQQCLCHNRHLQWAECTLPCRLLQTLLHETQRNHSYSFIV